MGNKAGFSKGTVIAKRIKSDNKYVPNSIMIDAKTFEHGRTTDSMNMNSGIVAVNTYIQSGIFTLGWNDVQNGKAKTTYKVPSNIPAEVKTNINMFWVTSGTNASTFVMDVDYRVVETYVSGVMFLSGAFNMLSGAVTNTTTTITPITGPFVGLQKATMVIPAYRTRPNSIVMMQLYRDVYDSSDTFPSEVITPLIEIEFVE
jgi:hypothetical protein